ncbi:MAG: hypothetical protein NXH75_01965 [Halobacteriovoraceae bacterium]|nr:hypothetical protein [Halobacteriovoraceae bacterium]
MKNLLLIILIPLISCAQMTAKEKRVAELKKQAKASPHHKKEYWKSYLQTPLTERLYKAPKELIKFIDLENQIYGFKENPKVMEIPNDYKKIFNQVIEEYPPLLKEKIKESLLAVFVVEDLGSSALTEAIKEMPKNSIMVFDKRVFTKKANDWCNWKERTPFKEGKWKLYCRIRNKKENGFKEAFQYIFTHELAHVINRADHGELPFWFDPIEDVDLEQKPFLKISWNKGEKTFQRRENENIYKDVQFYSKDKKLDNSKMNALYKILMDSQYPSLYAVTNPWDDFAEAFAVYYHTQYLKKPFSIILRNGRERFVYKSCIQTGTCPEKRDRVAKYFK